MNGERGRSGVPLGRPRGVAGGGVRSRRGGECSYEGDGTPPRSDWRKRLGDPRGVEGEPGIRGDVGALGDSRCDWGDAGRGIGVLLLLRTIRTGEWTRGVCGDLGDSRHVRCPTRSGERGERGD